MMLNESCSRTARIDINVDGAPRLADERTGDRPAYDVTDIEVIEQRRQLSSQLEVRLTHAAIRAP